MALPKKKRLTLTKSRLPKASEADIDDELEREDRNRHSGANHWCVAKTMAAKLTTEIESIDEALLKLDIVWRDESTSDPRRTAVSTESSS
jgi:hypothetical protein